jgi:hypothetical protein
MLRYITLLDSSFDLEQFIHETFQECFINDTCSGHVEGQKNYLAGVVDTLFRIGKINEPTRAMLHLIFFDGVEIEEAQRQVLEMGFKKEGLVEPMMLPDLNIPPINPLPPDEELGDGELGLESI